jgi:hypothetical protein
MPFEEPLYQAVNELTVRSEIHTLKHEIRQSTSIAEVEEYCI